MFKNIKVVMCVCLLLSKLMNQAQILFDNANSSKVLKQSKSLIYKLDSINWTAENTWEYIQCFFCSGMGNYHAISNQYNLINYVKSFRPYPGLSIVDYTKNTLLDIIFQDSVINYRVKNISGMDELCRSYDLLVTN